VDNVTRDQLIVDTIEVSIIVAKDLARLSNGDRNPRRAIAMEHPRTPPLKYS
jgi:hypothetical protein